MCQWKLSIPSEAFSQDLMHNKYWEMLNNEMRYEICLAWKMIW